MLGTGNAERPTGSSQSLKEQSKDTVTTVCSVDGRKKYEVPRKKSNPNVRAASSAQRATKR